MDHIRDVPNVVVEFDTTKMLRLTLGKQESILQILRGKRYVTFAKWLPAALSSGQIHLYICTQK